MQDSACLSSYQIALGSSEIFFSHPVVETEPKVQVGMVYRVEIPMVVVFVVSLHMVKVFVAVDAQRYYL